MTERLLQFIWQFQYFNKTELVTAEGEKVQILVPGQFNNNQGPDFYNAKIVIGETTWVGTVELHVNASDWDKHKHRQDKNYNNVILHVVWEDDISSYFVQAVEKIEALPLCQANRPVQYQLPLSIPLIELKSRVPKVLLQRYEDLMQSPAFIPCEKNLSSVRDITWSGWKERLLAERLLRKAFIVEADLQQNNFHWEETFWWMLARNFGMKVNGEAFEAMARSIPLAILARHKNQVHQLEALLLGQGGLLNERFQEEYPKLLQREYEFLREKYHLQPIMLPLYSLRMRPGNFPAVRMAELAMLVHESAHLFSKIIELNSAKEIKRLFEVTANDYWHYHYRFDETSAFKKKNTGVTMIDNIIINTVAPMLFAYGNYHNENRYKVKAIQTLEQVTGEKNLVTDRFRELKVEIKNARDSQALIELRNEYCNKKRCLECSVGNSILKQVN